MGFGLSRDGEPDGEHLAWDATEGGYRTLVKRERYKDSVLHGQQVDYSYTTGQALTALTYANGQLHGRICYASRSVRGRSGFPLT